MLLQHPGLTKFTCSMGVQGYLKDIGWVNSFIRKMPVDGKGRPLPWVTYPFIDFIGARLDKTMRVFEFGSGNSTLWYADRVKAVVSVEHDRFWYDKISHTMPANVSLNYQAIGNDGEYAKSAANLETEFDIVIVDGRDRVNCIKNALQALRSSGVIVVDDSEREAYTEGLEFLKDQGFRRLDFWGIAPAVFFKKCTSVFYRDDNLLGL